MKDELRPVVTPFDGRDNVVYTLATWASAAVFITAFWVVQTTAFGVSEGGEQLAVFIAIAMIAATFVLVWLGAPVSYLVGRRMRRVPGMLAHVATFWVLGAVASVGVLWLIFVALSPARSPFFEPVILLGAAVCGICTAIGRLVAFGSRRGHDKRRQSRPRTVARPPSGDI